MGCAQEEGRVRIYLNCAPNEKGLVSDKEMQIREYRVLLTELSNEERPRLQVMRMLNDILGIESSLAGSSEEINRDEFNQAVEPSSIKKYRVNQV